MVQQVLIVQIFVASPSDVRDEREQLEDIIAEANRSWARAAGVRLELLKWEDSVHPGFGEDAQSIINSQIGDRYDVFIGILWGRFGSRTPRAESGTEEEFDRALARFKMTGAPQLLVYFKDSPLNPSNIVPEELGKIQMFKKKIHENGGLFGSFQDMEGFQSSIRVHLSAVVQKLPLVEEIRAAKVEQGLKSLGNEDEDDLGYLDYLDQFEEQMPQLLSIIDEIGEATNRIGDQASEKAKEMEIATRSSGNMGQVRKITRRVSEELSTYAAVLDNKIPILGILSGTVFNALSNALALNEDFARPDTGELSNLHRAMEKALENISVTRVKMSAFRNVVAGLPRITKDMNQAKRAVVRELDALTVELDKIISLVSSIKAAVENMIADG